ncbi:MAG: amino acid ABC transporter permease, partial [Planctomycetota bacterium]|nr:amino acid ABC transporter permease [Planctomycetota bacterium]
LSYAMVMFSYIRLRLKRPELERPYRSPLGIPGAAVGGALSILALAATTFNKDYQMAIIWVAGFLAVGIGYYLLYSRHKLVAQAPEEEVALLAKQLGELDGKDGAE